MELDELKYQLNHQLAKDHASKSDADIAVLLKKRTHSVIGKLKRSLFIEIICCIVITGLMGYISITTSQWSLRVYFGVFTLLALAFLFLLVYLAKRITALSGAIMPVKSNLQTIVRILEEFVKRYFQFSMALIPVCFTFSLLLSRHDPIRIDGIDRVAVKLFSAPWQVYLFLVVYMLLLTVGLYYFNRWYLKKLYGKYLLQLKGCIGELKES